MGWKLTSLIIKNPGNVSDEKILDSLFEAKYKKLEPTTFDECHNPKQNNTIYFGNYKDNLIISTYAAELVERFSTKKISKAEEIFIEMFPNSEIGAFSLHSSVNHYAWTIISNGKKLRAKQGDGDNGISCDFGKPLPEEQEFLKSRFKDEDGEFKYDLKTKNGHQDIYSEDQIGENYVFKIWSRFTGVDLSDDDELKNAVEFRGYELEETVIDPANMTTMEEIQYFLHHAKNISLGYSEINFSSISSLDKAQIGYSVDSKGNSLITGRPGDWKESWIIIGSDNLGDPLFVDISKNDLPVYTSGHGEGEWKAILIATSLENFTEIIDDLEELSIDRESPTEIEENPISKKEQKKFLDKIKKENKGWDMSWWEVFLEND